MPCTYYTPAEEAVMAAEEREKIRAELDRVTNLLCSLCKTLESSKTTKPLVMGDTELAKWWTEHKRLDALRDAEIAAKLKARRKMTRLTKR